ncbi:MAG: zinc-dependent peptidase, partial [Bacteroidota bacterium]
MKFSEYVQSSIDDTIIHAELERSFPYFKTLDLSLQQRFVKRTSFFIQQKKFVARRELAMTDAIRILVTACAIQVTFGLDTYILDTFEYVVIYPNVYESPLTGKMHKGETNLSGFICLSWKHVLEGIRNPNDNYNLGLHEWTHALRFNSINYEATDYFFDGYINKWVAHALPEYTRLKNGKPSIFRRYGAANIHEFLSVCTEHFFESPDEFKSTAPGFFSQMCILFNQSPGKENPTKIDVRNKLLNVTNFPK